MLVIGATPSGDGLLWSGRRHDDDGPGAVHGEAVEGLFDAVFAALHDGEQVAVGFPAPLAVEAPDVEAALATAEREDPTVRQLARLLTELGRWRPWTVVSTSLPRWRATTSVLVWETDSNDLDAAVDAFFALASSRAEHGAESPDARRINLAAAAGVRSGLMADESQLREPVVLVSPAG